MAIATICQKDLHKQCPTRSTAGDYDQSRIDNIKRMADALWSKFPETYIILEHFTANSEETDLANFRVSEGKGMMLWGNF